MSKKVVCYNYGLLHQIANKIYYHEEHPQRKEELIDEAMELARKGKPYHERKE